MTQTRPTTPDGAAGFDDAVRQVREGASPDAAARALYDRLSPQERLGLLDGDVDFWPGMLDLMENGYNRTPYVHGAVPRLGIPGLRFSDGPRGVVMGSSTAFPVSMARGATWDVELEERLGDAIGREARAQGANFFGGVCINLPRHPAWGRAQETYGEDPILLGELGAALVRGTQGHVMACAKHYALNSMENARFTVDVTVDEATLHEVYLAHFRRVVEQGVDAIMSAYNSVNGEWCSQNEPLLSGVLREQWGFEGVAVSDFIWGLRDAAASLRAGLDVEEPFRQQRGQHLPTDLAEGRADWSDVERSCLRVLRTQLRRAAAVPDQAPGPDVVGSGQHRALAREAAARAMVLLRNEPVEGRPVLPLDPTTLRSLAVIGRLAGTANTGDHGSSDVHPPEVVTALAGLRAALPGVDVRSTEEDDPAAAAALAAGADAAVVVVGYTAEDEGEYIGADALAQPALVALYPPPPDPAMLAALSSQATPGGSLVGSQGMGGDRTRLTLRPEDEEILRAAAAANPRTVVAVVAAGAVIMESWRDRVPGIVMAWYSGMEGGHALADVLLGRVDPSGRLPFAIPRSEQHLPPFDPAATSITYDRWFGQRLLDRLDVAAAFPLGFGLSYTRFTLGPAAAERTSAETVTLTAPVTNAGDRAGRTVVQVYGVRQDGERAGERALLGFATVQLDAGESREVRVTASLRPLGRWDADRRALVVPGGDVVLEAASYAGDPERSQVALRLA